MQPTSGLDLCLRACLPAVPQIFAFRIHLNLRTFYCLERLDMRNHFIFRKAGPAFVDYVPSVVFANLLVLPCVPLSLMVPCQKELKATS